ncbi:TPA: radical SAM protein [Escherichia coli]|nr:radical SAM protein [Escherichia coli]
MKKNIVFIIKSNASNDELADVCFLPPLGVMSIATMLSIHGYNVRIIDSSLECLGSKDVIAIIKELDPVYVGISSYTENIDENLLMCKYIKKNLPHIPVMIGGSHPTVDSEYCKRKKYVDFIVVGEGEATNLEVAEAIRTNEKLIKFDKIEGLIYYSKEKGDFINNPKRHVINDLDLLPIIKRQFIEKSLQSPMITVISSRGCPGKCIYCAASQLSGSKYRVRSIENVFLETLLLLKLTSFEKEIYYCDDTFTGVIKRVKKFLNLIDGANINYRWRCESRVDILNANRYVIKEMVQRGCQRLQYGIESGNQEVLNSIFKQLDIGVVEDLIAYSISCGLRVAASFIFGHYCDTQETMSDTLEIMQRIKQECGNNVEIFYSFNTPFPGTYQYANMKDLGLKLTGSSYSSLNMLDPVVVTDNFDINMLRSFGQKAQFLML